MRPPIPPPPAHWDRALRPLDRRGFLRLAGAAAAAGVFPAGCGGVPAELAPAPDLPLEVLSARGYATFQAAALRIIGARGAEAVRAGHVDPAAAADAWMARAPALAAPLGQALWVLEWGVAPLVAKWRPFTALDGVEQDRVLDDLMRSRFDLKRSLFKGVKSLSTLTFYAHPASHGAVGYPGPFDRAGIAAAMSDLTDG
ncbi:MAG: twin-arginine translocation signal domain-containing protein [Myxococcota bacterium]|nr:twin-arginine translocation signal domain-containing protein [Myxococcota bacterium]